MAESDWEFLRGIFLMEAWDTVATVEEGLPRLLEAAPPPDALAPLVVVAHRLKGAAALHGLPGTAELAGLLETALESASRPGRGVEAYGVVVDIVAALKPVLDGIAATGAEDPVVVGRFWSGRPGVRDVGRATPASPAPSGSRPGETMLREARDFFAEHGDVLAYFGPEAAEHLESIARSIGILERSGPEPDEAEIHALFRAVHTLKGAAYTVGCDVVGRMAHRAEDVLDAVRERRLPWSPALLDALFRATDAMKVLVGTPDATVGDAGAVIEGAVQALAALATDGDRDAGRAPSARAPGDGRPAGGGDGADRARHRLALGLAESRRRKPGRGPASGSGEHPGERRPARRPHEPGRRAGHRPEPPRPPLPAARAARRPPHREPRADEPGGAGLRGQVPRSSPPVRGGGGALRVVR